MIICPGNIVSIVNVHEMANNTDEIVTIQKTLACSECSYTFLSVITLPSKTCKINYERYNVIIIKKGVIYVNIRF